MTYVYILSHYHEYGAENVVATLDRLKLADLLKANWSEATQTEDMSGLENLLLRPDEELAREDGNDLSSGWGGIQLHVVLLDATTKNG